MDCIVPQTSVFGHTLVDPSTFVATTIGAVIGFVGLFILLFMRRRAWHIFCVTLVLFIIMHIAAMMVTCFMPSSAKQENFPPTTVGGVFTFTLEYCTTLMALNATFGALIDLFSTESSVDALMFNVSSSLIVFGGWTTLFFLWTKATSSPSSTIDPKLLQDYTTESFLIGFVVLELIWVALQRKCGTVTLPVLLIAGLLIGLSAKSFLSDNRWDLCDNPIVGWFTYEGTWFFVADVLCCLGLAFYYVSRPSSQIAEEEQYLSYLKFEDDPMTQESNQLFWLDHEAAEPLEHHTGSWPKGGSDRKVYRSRLIGDVSDKSSEPRSRATFESHTKEKEGELPEIIQDHWPYVAEKNVFGDTSDRPRVFTDQYGFTWQITKTNAWLPSPYSSPNLRPQVVSQTSTQSPTKEGTRENDPQPLQRIRSAPKPFATKKPSMRYPEGAQISLKETGHEKIEKETGSEKISSE